VELRTLVRSRGVEGTFKTLGSGAEPRTPLPLLATGLTKRRGPDQRLPGRGPAIWMRMVRIIHLQVVIQTACKVLNRTTVAPFEQAARQDTAPPFDLIEP
jgi:hypothetical protein